MGKEKILILGRNGQVGNELFNLISSAYNGFSSDDTVFLDRTNVDLTNEEQLRSTLQEHAPTAIINAAAYTAVDKAEDEESIAMAVNATAPAIMAQYAEQHGACLIHISTDYVFDGHKDGAYEETDATCPLNIYGKSKAKGEEAIMSTSACAIILRTSWVYAAKGVNFVHTMLRLGQERDALSIVSDQTGAPTDAKDIATAILDVLPKMKKNNTPQLFHMCAGGEGSWYDFARLIFDEAKQRGYKTPQSLTAIPSSAYPTPATRPLNSRLNCRALTKEYGITLPQWDDSVRDCLNRIFQSSEQNKAIA